MCEWLSRLSRTHTGQVLMVNTSGRHRRLGSSRRDEERGAVAVEFALVMIPFLVLLFGIIQYGVYFWAVQGGSSAAREAARNAAVGQPEACADFQSDVEEAISALTDGSATITREYQNVAGQPVQVGDDVVVSVEFQTFDFNFPFLPFINGGTVESAATARVEYVPSLTIGDCS